MWIMRFAARTMLCLGLAACGQANPVNTVEQGPPCPGYVTGGEAIRIAREFAGVKIEEYEARPSWNHAQWSVFVSVPDRPYSQATVTISPNGRVTSCDGFRDCVSPVTKPADRCALATKDTVSEGAAIRIALEYLREGGIDHATDGAHAVWWAAHWSVWFVQKGPSSPDSDFTVLVSHDGSEIESVGALVIPSRDGFLFRQPRTD